MPAKKAGRPSKYSETLADEIYERVSLAEPVYKICEDAHMPSESILYRWLHTNEEFRQKLARARENCADHLSFEMLDIADELKNEKRSMVAVQAAKVRIDTREKLMQMLKPKSYGNKVQQEISGKDGGPIQAEITVQFVKPTNAAS